MASSTSATPDSKKRACPDGEAEEQGFRLRTYKAVSLGVCLFCVQDKIKGRETSERAIHLYGKTPMGFKKTAYPMHLDSARHREQWKAYKDLSQTEKTKYFQHIKNSDIDEIVRKDHPLHFALSARETQQLQEENLELKEENLELKSRLANEVVAREAMAHEIVRKQEHAKAMTTLQSKLKKWKLKADRKEANLEKKWRKGSGRSGESFYLDCKKKKEELLKTLNACHGGVGCGEVQYIGIGEDTAVIPPATEEKDTAMVGKLEHLALILEDSFPWLHDQAMVDQCNVELAALGESDVPKPSVVVLSAGRLELYIQTEDKSSEAFDFLVELVPDLTKDACVTFLKQRVRLDKRLAVSDDLGSLGLLLAEAGTKGQGGHIDLDQPRAYQGSMILSSGHTGTLFENTDRDGGVMDGDGVMNTTFAAKNLKQLKNFQDMPDCVYTVLKESKAPKELLSKYGRVFLRPALAKPTIGGSATLPATSCITMRGGVVHAGPSVEHGVRSMFSYTITHSDADPYDAETQYFEATLWAELMVHILEDDETVDETMRYMLTKYIEYVVRTYEEYQGGFLLSARLAVGFLHHQVAYEVESILGSKKKKKKKLLPIDELVEKYMAVWKKQMATQHPMLEE